MVTQEEEWRPVVGHPDYRVSNTGRVVSRKRRMERELRGGLADGYRRVMLSNSGERKFVGVHILVAAAFIGPRPDGQEVRHLDGNRLHNTLSNLSYGTRSDNMQDRLAHGTDPNASKTHCKWGHEFTEQNTWTTAGSGRGGRWCRACRRRRQRAYEIRKALAAANVPDLAA